MTTQTASIPARFMVGLEKRPGTAMNASPRFDTLSR